MIKWHQYQVMIEPLAKASNCVYQGFDVLRDIPVAIKVCRRIKRAEKEAEIMQDYGKHPCLPRFYDFFVQDKQAYIVMELVKGQRINCPKGGPVRDPMLAIAITRQILEGLKHLHRCGFIHFDIAHHNIMIENDKPQTVKILDYCGSVRKNAKGIWLTKRRGGTINFRPPEQEQTPCLLSPASDLYSVARLCYWLITRSLPSVSRPFSLPDKQLQSLLGRGMQTESKLRYQSATEFIQALDNWEQRKNTR